MLRRPVAPKSPAWPSFAGSLRAPANRSAGRRRRPDGKDSGRRSRAFRRGSLACRRCPSSQGLHPWEHIGPDGSSSPAHSRRPSDTARRLAEQKPEGLAPGLAASPRRPAGAAPSRRVPRWEGFPPSGFATALGSCSGSPRAPRRAASRKRRWRNASLFEIASASRVEGARGGVGGFGDPCGRWDGPSNLLSGRTLRNRGMVRFGERERAVGCTACAPAQSS